MRILVVDDNAAVRRSIRSLLMERADWSVCDEAADGIEAVAKARELRPDVILMDIAMPRMDGLEATRLIREQLPETKVVIVSQSAPAIVKRQSEEVGATAWLTKDVLVRDLIRTVESTCPNGTAAAAEGPASREFPRASDKSGRRRLYEAVLQNMPDLGFVLDLNHRFVYANEALLSVWGQTWESAIGKTCLELGHERWRAALADREIDRVIATKQPVRGEVPYTGTNGQRIYDYILFPVFGPDGDVEAVAGTTRDITEMRLFEDATRESEELFRAMFEQTIVGVAQKDLEGRFTLVNDRYCEIVGRSREELLTLSMQDVTHPDDVGRNLQLLAAIAGGRGRSFDIEKRYVRPDGQCVWVRDQVSAVRDASGKLAHVLVAVTDISDLKATEAALRAAKESTEEEIRRRTFELSIRTQQLEASNTEIKRQAEALHELSTALLRTQDEERRRIARELHDSAGQTLAILGIQQAQLAERIQRELPEASKQMEELESITEQLTREIRTTSYLLHPPMLEDIGLASALRWYVNGLEARSGIKIDLKVSDNFGRLPADAELSLFRVVQECLTNIHRHSESKDAVIRIARSDGRVSVEIQDHGKGILPERLTDIQLQGGGVGIRGMRERLRNLDGELTIQSDGSGTTFLATLPVAESQNATASGTEVQASPLQKMAKSS